MTASVPGSSRLPRRLHWFLAGSLCGALAAGTLVYQALCYHLIRTEAGLVRLEKSSPSFRELYLDVRNYGPVEWGRHKTVVLAIMRAGRFDLLKSEPLDEQQARLGALMQSLQTAEIPQELLGGAASDATEVVGEDPNPGEFSLEESGPSDRVQLPVDEAIERRAVRPLRER